MNLYHTGLSEIYKEIEALGDPLTGISDRIDFERIRPMCLIYMRMIQIRVEEQIMIVNAGQDWCKIAGIKLIHPI